MRLKTDKDIQAVNPELTLDIPYYQQLQKNQALLQWLIQFEMKDRIHEMQESGRCLIAGDKIYHC